MEISEWALHHSLISSYMRVQIETGLPWRQLICRVDIVASLAGPAGLVVRAVIRWGGLCYIGLHCPLMRAGIGAGSVSRVPPRLQAPL